MKCPECGLVNNHCKVLDSRTWNHTIRRRRMCSHCGYRWTTFEASEFEFFSDRNRNKCWKWSVGEEETLVRLKEQGLSNTAIAAKLCRTRIAITRKLDRLMANGEYFSILDDLKSRTS